MRSILIAFRAPFLWAPALCLGLLMPVFAEQTVVPHFDPLVWDSGMSLKDTVQITLERYPQTAVVGAKQQQTEALRRRSGSLLAGTPNIWAIYGNDLLFDDTGYHYVETQLQLPLWKWGQRAAGQSLAEEADKETTAYAVALQFQVAGLVREALWDLRLKENLHDLAEQALRLSDRLVETVERRVEAGDLPRADLVLAKSDRVEKKSALARAEAELMHARRRYITLTQSNRAPVSFEERQSARADIAESHPLLAAANAVIARLQANLHWVRRTGSGQQPSIYLGSRHEKDFRNEPTIDSINVAVTIPFGGGAVAAPKIAKANLALTEALAERQSLLRRLGQGLHEAKHELEVDHVELSLAEERKKFSEQYLRMSRIGFQAGEIQLIDLLRIQSRTQAAIRNARERNIRLQRDIARYNQAVGELP
jgi:outer membrane protein, heavy metal efflux system